MVKRKEVHEWLKDDPRQLDWAKEYLRKKGLNQSHAQSHALLIHIVNAQDAETRRSMRTAWNQQVSKENGKRKTRSFALSNEASRVLKQTAQQQNCSQVQVIERLLTDLSQLKKEVQQHQEGKQRAPKNIDRLAQSQQLKINGLKKMLLEWQAQTDAFLLVGARYRVALEAVELLDKNYEPTLNLDQAARAVELQAQWKDAITKTVEANTRLGWLLARPLDQLSDN